MVGAPTGTVTFLFTDIEGSTRLAREHPETWETLRARHHAILHHAIEAHRGYVFQIIGDAFCVAFHTAGDALRAAAKAQIDLHSEAWGNASVKVRMGIHTGKAEVQQSGEYQGYLVMSRVQRLMSAGHGGQVLISAATQELLLEDLPEDVSLRDLGERRLKDLIRPEHIYQLVIPGLPVDFPPLKTLDFYRHNLPVQLTSFVGRQKEMEEIKQFIMTHRLVSLTGVGGTGKTRLALQVAADLLDQSPQGVWFVELAPLTDPALIPQAILSAFGIPERSGLTQQQQLLDYLHEKKLLLVLDNCEHLIQACAELTDILLSNNPNLTILATGREALGVPGELVWHVPSLSLPSTKQLPAIDQLSQYEAVQLFIERATLVQPHFHVTNDNAPAIAQICFRLDGIPLAIELAAARVRALSINQIVQRLDDRFRLLTGGSRTALERHQTLRAAIDWSYNLLSSDEKILFCGLSVFVGGWTLEAAEQVCVGNNDISSQDVLELLTHLVDKSLVILDESRYRMLETTRQYAREILFDSEEMITLRNQHFAYFLDLAEQADRETQWSNKTNWQDRLGLDTDNFRAALEWCVSEETTEAALRLLGAWASAGRPQFNEIHDWFNKIRLLLNVKTYPAPYARLLNYIGVHSWLRGEYRYAQSIVEESQAIWLKLGVDGELGLAEACLVLGAVVLSTSENIKTTQSFYEQSLELYQKHGDQNGIALVTFHLGNKALYEGHYSEAEGYYMKSLAQYQELGDNGGVGNALCALGEVARLQNDYERAANFYERGLKILRELRGRYTLPNFLFNFAWAPLHRGDYRYAKVLFQESLELWKENGDKNGIIICLAGFAGILGMSNKPEEAARLFGAFECLLEGSVTSLDSIERKEIDHFIALVRDQLNEGTFAKARTEGRAMTLDQAIAFALEESDE